MTEPYTVIGIWDEEDRRHVVGVIKGEQDVRGGEDVFEGGLFADYVEATSYEDAEAQVHGTREVELCEVCEEPLDFPKDDPRRCSKHPWTETVNKEES